MLYSPLVLHCSTWHVQHSCNVAQVLSTTCTGERTTTSTTFPAEIYPNTSSTTCRCQLACSWTWRKCRPPGTTSKSLPTGGTHRDRSANQCPHCPKGSVKNTPTPRDLPKGTYPRYFVFYFRKTNLKGVDSREIDTRQLGMVVMDHNMLVRIRLYR